MNSVLSLGRPRTYLGGLAFLLCLGMAGAALAQETTAPEPPADLVAAAQQEGTVIFYGGTAVPVLDAAATAFQAKYGITVQYQRLASGPQRQRIEQEASTKSISFDVSQLSDEAWVSDMADKGLWAKLDPARLPSLQKVPPELQHDSYAVGSLVALTLIYNTDLVPADQVPKTAQDLLDPRWKGQFAIANTSTGLGVQTGYYAWLDKMGKDGFAKYMHDLFALEPRVVESGSNGAQQVAAGELSYVLQASAAFAPPLIEQGAPIAVAFPDPTGITVRTFQVAAEGPHPNAAQLFLNWLMSPEGLEIMNGGQQAASPYPGTPTALQLPDTGLVIANPKDVAAASAYIQQVFDDVSK